jgi:hypothetical protein
VNVDQPRLSSPTRPLTLVEAVAPSPGAPEPAPASAPGLQVRGEHSPDFADLVDEWGRQSFPASDPPANW